ncbi:MAG: hypothetical protein J0M15_01715 [Deltaproteobacteria bacterium]|jgi:hypothetical protein|nr:hypothetical protein [Deltaproteobacteria bacterium]
MKIILYLLLSFRLALAQFETPVVTKTEFLQDSDLVEGEKVKLICKAFHSLTIVEKLDPGFVGNSIYFKNIKDLDSNKKLRTCDDLKLEGFKKVESQGAILWGVKAHFLFLKDADELSSRTKFEIYDSEKYVKVFSGVRNNDLLFELVTVGNKKYALEYFQRYKVPCDFDNDKSAKKCWFYFLKDLQMNLNQSKKNSPDKFVNLPLPSCPQSKKSKKFQVYLKIQVPNIEKNIKKILFAKPICELAP